MWKWIVGLFAGSVGAAYLLRPSSAGATAPEAQPGAPAPGPAPQAIPPPVIPVPQPPVRTGSPLNVAMVFADHGVTEDTLVIYDRMIENCVHEHGVPFVRVEHNPYVWQQNAGQPMTVSMWIFDVYLGPGGAMPKAELITCLSARSSRTAVNFQGLSFPFPRIGKHFKRGKRGRRARRGMPMMTTRVVSVAVRRR